MRTSVLSDISPGLVPAHSPALEPGMIALEVFDRVPAWATVHAASDNSTAPLICRGEIAIVAGDGRAGVIPERGALYLIEYASKGPRDQYERRARHIVQARESQRGDGWWAAPYRSHDGRTVYMSDGPYSFDQLASKLIGRVVGIFGPSRVGGC